MVAPLTIHNLSSVALTPEELQLLSKGLSFAPTPSIPRNKMYIQTLNYYDLYARSLRTRYVNAVKYYAPTPQPEKVETTTTSKIYRRLKFLPRDSRKTATQEFSGIQKVEYYIELTKNNLNDELSMITKPPNHNITSTDKETIQKFNHLTDKVIIKPADKNLGIVLMDTDDYIGQCISHLSDTNTYRLATNYPRSDIKKQVMNTVIRFKPQIHQYNWKLYNFLLSEPDHSRIPQFYGIPKIHKKFTRIPPVRPIVSQCNSVLTPTAKFIDHVLQPLAQSYPDYLHNSSLISTTANPLCA